MELIDPTNHRSALISVDNGLFAWRIVPHLKASERNDVRAS